MYLDVYTNEKRREDWTFSFESNLARPEEMDGRV
jgi:hypothetical protein